MPVRQVILPGLKILVMVVAIGISAAVAPPYVNAAISRIDADWASADVASALAEGREQAIRQQRTVSVRFHAAQRSVEVEGGRWRKLHGAVKLSAPAPGRDGRPAVAFHPDGSSSGGQVVVASKDHAWSVVVERETGAIRRFQAVR